MTYKPAAHKTLDGRTEDGRIPWEVSCILDTDPLRKPSWRLCFWWRMMMMMTTTIKNHNVHVQLVYVLVFKLSCGTGRTVFRSPKHPAHFGIQCVVPRIRFRALQRSAKSAMPSSTPPWSRISRYLLDLATQIRNTLVYVQLMLGNAANYKQDMQFMRNVTLRHVRATIVAVEKQ